MSLRLSFFILASVVAYALSAPATYDPKEINLKANELPAELKNAGIKEKLSGVLDLNLKFKDENGQAVSLEKYFSEGKPVVLSLIYYSCPNLCNFHLNGLNDAMRKLKWTVGKEFKVVSVSFDPSETTQVAEQKKASYLKAYGRAEAQAGWHFLTGEKSQIDALAKSVGFDFYWDEQKKEWAHSSAAILITPEGKISRYLHGVYFEEKDLRFALIEASEGKIGTVIDSILFYCFHFDPKKNKYTLYAYNVMKAGATVTIFLLGLFLLPLWVRERKVSKGKDGDNCCSGH